MSRAIKEWLADLEARAANKTKKSVDPLTGKTTRPNTRFVEERGGEPSPAKKTSAGLRPSKKRGVKVDGETEWFGPTIDLKAKRKKR